MTIDQTFQLQYDGWLFTASYTYFLCFWININYVVYPTIKLIPILLRYDTIKSNEQNIELNRISFYWVNTHLYTCDVLVFLPTHLFLFSLSFLVVIHDNLSY